MLVVAFTYTGLFAFISGSSHVLIGLVGLTPDLFGMCFATGVLGFIAGSLLAGRLSLRVGTAGLMPVGTSISALGGALGLLLALLTPPNVPGVVGPMVVFMLGAGFTFPSAIALALAPYPTKAGLASALLGFVQLLARRRHRGGDQHRVRPLSLATADDAGPGPGHGWRRSWPIVSSSAGRDAPLPAAASRGSTAHVHAPRV